MERRAAEGTSAADSSPSAFDMVTVAPETLSKPNARSFSSSAGSGSGSSHVSESSKRRKRPLSKREPTREEYADEEDFQSAWSKWREDRDHNNKSVRLSREKAKMRRVQGEQAKQNKKHSKHGGETVQDKLARTQKELRLLVQMIKRPDTLSDFDLAIVERIIGDNDESATEKMTKGGRVSKYGTNSHMRHSASSRRTTSKKR